MLKTCTCVLTNAETLPEMEGDIIGVDRGALICFKNGIQMKAALGDFDSITELDRELLKKSYPDMMILNPRKDVSDSEAALIWATDMGYEKKILVSPMSGRFDHSYVNFQLVKKYDCILVDQNNRIFLIHEGTTEIYKDYYKYISFFACDQANVTLEGFSYPLHEYVLKSDDVLILSNEILNKKGQVTTTGKLWCIQSNDAI